MQREIALPYSAVLDAINALAVQDIYLLGWEALATYPNGEFGYPSDGIMGFSPAPIHGVSRGDKGPSERGQVPRTRQASMPPATRGRPYAARRTSGHGPAWPLRSSTT